MDVRQLHTRFLWPFLLGDRAVDDVARELANGWRHESLPRLYSDELLKQARDFIDHDVAYFKYEDARSVFPQRLSAVLSDGVIVPVKIPPRAGIELFVTGEGVGILSIMLTVSAEDIPAAVLLDFNYRVGRKSNALPAMLHVMHPSEDDARWSRIEETARVNIRPAPSDDAPPSERIGVPGGTYTLAEVVDELLAPLEKFHRRDVQSHFSVYTVASFSSAVVFDDTSCLSWAGPFLSGLAQVEEPVHAGSSPGAVDVPNLLMNRCHWAAVGVLGAAHLIADQPAPEGQKDHPFNPQRMHRIRDKYFVPYLLGLIQRHVLNRMAEEAVELVRTHNDDELRALRMRLLGFGIGGRFSQVSSRHALHRYYRLVQDGLDVPQAWSEVRDALSEIDASNIAMNVATNVASMNRLQHAAHALEYVIISVYAAHLWHMFASENEDLYRQALRWLKPLLPSDRTLPRDWFVAWGVLVFATLGLFLVFVYNRASASLANIGLRHSVRSL